MTYCSNNGLSKPYFALSASIICGGRPFSELNGLHGMMFINRKVNEAIRKMVTTAETKRLKVNFHMCPTPWLVLY